jgi:hypothetical protein
MAEIRGTIFERDYGRFTVLAAPTWDPKQDRYRRPSLGTFKTRDEAVRAALDYNVNQADGVFSLSEVEQRKVRLDRYLDEWLELVGLAWPDVDSDAGTISTRQTIQVDGRSPYVKGPKSRNGCRTIGLGPDTIRQLRRHPNEDERRSTRSRGQLPTRTARRLVGEVHDH